MTLEEYFRRYPDSEYKNYLGFNIKNNEKKNIAEGMLLFDNDSASSWGGPFPGNFAFFKLFDCSKIGGFKNLLNESEQVARFICNYNKNSRRKLDHLNKEYEVLINQAKNEYPTIEKPYRLYMSGNDDTSYSKNFSSKDEGLEFVSILEALQPLNLFKDIMPNFAFTN